MEMVCLAPVVVGGGVLERWLAGDVGGKLWGHCIHVGDAVPCCVFVLEAFVDEASVAGDTRGGVPAVDVAMVWVRGV